MTGVRITGLPAAQAAQATDIIPVVQDGVTKKETLQQILDLVSTNFNVTWKEPCRLLSSTAKTVTYDNVAGTLTNAGTQAALVIDSTTVALNDRILVIGQTNQIQNGIYTATNLGSVSTNWVLTRASDFDGSVDGQISAGDATVIFDGTAYANTLWFQQTQGTIVIGTSNITFSELSLSTQGGYLEITNGMLSLGNYTITNPCPSFVFLKVTSGPYTITLPAANATNSRTAGLPIRFEFDAGATTSVNFLSNSGALQFSTTQSGPIDVDYSTNSTANGTPWRLTGYVTSIGPASKTGDVTLEVSDISDAGTMALQNANAVNITGGDITGETNINVADSIVVTASLAGSLSMSVLNTNNANAAANAYNFLISGGPSAGDSATYYGVDTGGGYYVGIDNSDGDKGKISTNSGLGVGDLLTWDSSGNFIYSGTGLFPNTGLKVKDVGGSFKMIWKPGSTFTADRTFTVTTGDANRTLDLTAGSVTYGALGIANDALTTLTQNGVIYGNAAAAFGATAAGTTGQILVATTSSAPTWAASLAGDFSYTSATSGANRTVTISHSSNTASSNSLFNATVAGTSAGDPYYTSVITGGATWSWGADNSNGDAFVISASATLGSSDCFNMLTTGAASFLLGNVDVTKSSSGTDVSLTASNTSNTASSSASIIAKVAGGTAADPVHQSIITGGASWTWGADNSASDNFVVSASTALGTTDCFSITTGGAASFVLGDLDVTRSSSGGNVLATVSNTSNSASSNAIITAKVAGTSAADPYFQSLINGGQAWTSGLDNSDSDAFVISSSSALGTSNIMRVATTGEINYPLQSCFSAYLSASLANATGNGTTVTLVCNTELFDQNSDYNNATGTYTCPITSRILFSCGVTFTTVAGSSVVTFISTSNRDWQCYGMNSTNTKDGASSLVLGGNAFLVDMDAADTAVYRVQNSGGTLTTGITGSASVPATFFAGMIVA